MRKTNNNKAVKPLFIKKISHKDSFRFKSIALNLKLKNNQQKIAPQLASDLNGKSLDSINAVIYSLPEANFRIIDEINANMGALSQAASLTVDEVNRLIKKMTLSFSNQKNESSFYVKDGIFNGAHFIVQKKEQELALIISQSSQQARVLLQQKEHLLATRLKKHGINLGSIRFSL